jgi:hypothetical protein
MLVYPTWPTLAYFYLVSSLRFFLDFMGLMDSLLDPSTQYGIPVSVVPKTLLESQTRVESQILTCSFAPRTLNCIWANIFDCFLILHCHSDIGKQAWCIWWIGNQLIALGKKTCEPTSNSSPQIWIWITGIIQLNVLRVPTRLSGFFIISSLWILF